MPQESVDAMLARHGLDRAEASSLWLDPMTSLEMFEGLTGLNAAETRKLCVALNLTMKKPFIPQPEQVAPEDDPDPPSIVGLIDMREAVEEVFAPSGGRREEVLREDPASPPQRYSQDFTSASPAMLAAGRAEIERHSADAGGGAGAVYDAVAAGDHGSASGGRCRCSTSCWGCSTSRCGAVGRSPLVPSPRRGQTAPRPSWRLTRRRRGRWPTRSMTPRSRAWPRR